jgi:hypothetical protein
MIRFDNLLGTGRVQSFIDGVMKEVNLGFNGGFIP